METFFFRGSVRAIPPAIANGQSLPVAAESSPFFSSILQRSSLAAVLGLGAEVSVLVGLALHGQLPVAFEANQLVDLRANKSQNFTPPFGRTVSFAVKSRSHQ